jgi:stress-induced morphogen
MSDLAKRLRETTHMYQADCELKMKCAARIEELEAKLAAIDDLMVRRIRHHQEMKGLGGSGMAMKREHYKLHVLSETLGGIRKVTKARTTLAELKGQNDE